MAIIIVDWCVRVSLMESQWPIFSYIVLLLGICTIFDSAYLELCMLNSVLATLESSKGTLGCLRGGDVGHHSFMSHLVHLGREELSYF